MYTFLRATKNRFEPTRLHAVLSGFLFPKSLNCNWWSGFSAVRSGLVAVFFRLCEPDLQTLVTSIAATYLDFIDTEIHQISCSGGCQCSHKQARQNVWEERDYRTTYKILAMWSPFAPRQASVMLGSCRTTATRYLLSDYSMQHKFLGIMCRKFFGIIYSNHWLFLLLDMRAHLVFGQRKTTPP